MELKLVHPSTFVVSGPTGSGKTKFVVRLLKERMIAPFPERIVWVYGEWQPLYDELKLYVPGIEFKHGAPQDLYDSLDAITTNMVVLDDQMSEAGDSKELCKLFTQGSHHKNLSVLYIVQNLFDKGRSMRTVSLNTQYLIVFKSPRDKTQIAHLGRQMYPRSSRFLIESFDDATKEPYGYLLIDMRPETDDECRVRTKIFPGETCYVYEPRKA